MKFLKTFLFKLEDGFVLVLTLLILPAMLSLSLLLVDISRVNNAHGDLQLIADSVALAGARELDRTPAAIANARLAMAEVTNNVSMLGKGGSSAEISITYANVPGNAVQVVFLDDIPDNDDTPIDTAWLTAHQVADADAEDARYVWVQAQSNDFDPFFFFMRRTSADSNEFDLPEAADIPVGAVAVATNPGPVACNVSPIFICNPFEGTANPDFNANFESGNLYGRLFELYFSNTGTSPGPGPGNFGFLRVAGGNGADVLREALAIGDSQACYQQSGVDTEPGATVGPVEAAIGTHFGLYFGNLSSVNDNPLYRPAKNVRMGQVQTGNNCRTYDPEEIPIDATGSYAAFALPPGETMLPLPGGAYSDGPDWDIDLYWDVNHGGHTTPPPFGYTPPPAPEQDIRNYSSTYPTGITPVSVTPSRFDTYNYELSSDVLMENQAPNGEDGISQCSSLDLDDYSEPDYKERRVIFSAVVNCNEHSALLQGAATGVPSVSFVRSFLTKPAEVSGSNRKISLEFIDTNGPGGLGSLAELIREEAYLVR